MSLGGLSGLASGVDTSGLVDQLISLERQGTARLGLRRSAVQARQTQLKEIASRLSALNAAAKDLATAATWKAAQTAESSDPSRVTAALAAGAGIGGHTIQVDRLASSAQRGYAWTPSATASSFDIAYSDDPLSKVTIDVKANATAAEVAAAINGKGAAPVFASVIKDPVSGAERLVLAARKTGEDSVFTVDASRLQAGQLDEKPAYERTGPTLDAEYRLDGSATPLNSPTNVVENAIAGVKLTLKGVTTAPASITVSEPAIDESAIKAKVQGFVDAYNALVTATRNAVTEKAVPGATTAFDAGKGQLFGDSGLLGMLSSLRIRMSEAVGGVTGVDELADLGIAIPKATGTSSQSAKDGKLSLDSAKLAETLTADSTKVRDFFAAFSTGLEAYVKTQTGTSGVLDARAKSSDAEIKRITDQATRAEERIAAKEKRLRAQFAAMESALARSQTQGAWLDGQIAALTRRD